MIGIQFIRQNPDLVRDALKKRHDDAPLDDILQLDLEHRKLIQEVETLRAEQNARSKEIVQLKGETDPNHRKVSQLTLGLHGDGLRVVIWPSMAAEDAFADNLGRLVQQPVQAVNRQAGHAHIVGVGIEEGDGESAAPILDHCAAFALKHILGGGDP